MTVYYGMTMKFDLDKIMGMADARTDEAFEKKYIYYFVLGLLILALYLIFLK